MDLLESLCNQLKVRVKKNKLNDCINILCFLFLLAWLLNCLNCLILLSKCSDFC